MSQTPKPAQTRTNIPKGGYKVRPEDLARTLNEVLLLDHRSIRASEGYRLVRLIFKTIKKALLRGESVWIPGFGKFKLHTRPPTRRTCGYFYGNKNKFNAPQILKSLPPKTYVHFTPAKPLLRFLNEQP